MQGYWDDPEATAERLRPGRWPWERVLATGDLFRRDEEGYLYFVGRRDDIIKSRGEKVVPREVEESSSRGEGVGDAAVIGVADRLLGQAIHAHVAPADGEELDPAALRRHCAERLEEYMVPKRVVVHEAAAQEPERQGGPGGAAGDFEAGLRDGAGRGRRRGTNSERLRRRVRACRPAAEVRGRRGAFVAPRSPQTPAGPLDPAP